MTVMFIAELIVWKGRFKDNFFGALTAIVDRPSCIFSQFNALSCFQGFYKTLLVSELKKYSVRGTNDFR